eukprot:353596-Chlamydomonas_euryale.AAC.3
MHTPKHPCVPHAPTPAHLERVAQLVDKSQLLLHGCEARVAGRNGRSGAAAGSRRSGGPVRRSLAALGGRGPSSTAARC